MAVLALARAVSLIAGYLQGRWLCKALQGGDRDPEGSDFLGFGELFPMRPNREDFGVSKEQQPHLSELQAKFVP